MERNADWVIAKAYLFAQRKSSPPPSGSNKYNALLELADSLQREWASEPNTEWSSLYALTELADPITATDTYAIPNTVMYLSKQQTNPLYALSTDGNTQVMYNLVDIGILHANTQTNPVAQQGSNLIFEEAFTSDSPVFGGSINVPSILYPSDITAGTDIIQVDDPEWLAWMMGADFVRNDFARQNQYANMLNHANLLMEKMKERNMGQTNQLIVDYPIMGTSW